MSALALALVPWGFGPSPSAHPVANGAVVQAQGSGFISSGLGARIGGQLAAFDRVTLNIDGFRHGGWALCPDCKATGVSSTVRVTAVRHPAFHAAAWVQGSLSLGSPEGMAGVAIEGGTRHLRVDGSVPLVSSTFLITTLRVGPEVGVTGQWTTSHATRLAVIGVEPGVGIQHRWRVSERVELELAARVGEEGAGGSGTLRMAL